MTGFYTRTGDNGFTGLLGKERVPKHHPRPQAVGALDEATAALGAARAFASRQDTQNVILTCQRDLYGIMAEVAATEDNAEQFRTVDENRVAWLEGVIDQLAAQIDLPKEFIVPGDSQAGGLLSLARAIVRRAERQLAHLYHEGFITNSALLSYMNRLSSLCFILELAENQAAGRDLPTLAKK